MSPSRKIHYLDNAATSWPKPEGVLKGIVDFMSGVAANAGRSGHRPAVESARMVYRCREQLALLLNVPNPADIAFTSGTTEGLNLVLKGFLHRDDKVLVSPMEHNALMRPLERLKKDIGISYEILPADRFGRIDAPAAATFADGDVKLLCINHGSNVNGIVQDIRALRNALPGIPLLVDAAQTAGVIPIDVIEDGIDFVACSGHKGLLGPTGIGACYISPKYQVPPLIEGGTGSKSESLTHPEFRPDCYEGGTANLHGIAGLRGGLGYIEENGLTGTSKRRMTSMLIDGLRDIPRVVLHTPVDASALLLSLTIEGAHTDEVSVALENDYNILCRPGLHCAPLAHRHLNTIPGGTVRLSPGFGNTDEDIEIAIEAVKAIALRS